MDRRLAGLIKQQSKEIGQAVRTVSAPPPPRLNPASILRSKQVAQSPRPATVQPRRPASQASGALKSLAPPTLAPFRARLQAYDFEVNQPKLASVGASRTRGSSRQQDEDAPWGVYQLPDGQMVAMPSEWASGLPDGSQQHGEDVTDPAAIERARQSDIAYLNQPEEVQALIQTPLDQPATGGGTLFMGDDQARFAEESANEAASNIAVADQIKKLQRQETPVSMASDLSRQQADTETERQAAKIVTDTLKRQAQVSDVASEAIAASARQLRQAGIDVSRNQAATDPVYLLPGTGAGTTGDEDEDDGNWFTDTVNSVVGAGAGQLAQNRDRAARLLGGVGIPDAAKDVALDVAGQAALQLAQNRERLGNTGLGINEGVTDIVGDVAGELARSQETVDKIGDWWQGVGDWSEEDVIPAWNTLMEDVAPVLDMLRPAMTTGVDENGLPAPVFKEGGPVDPADVVQGAFAVTKATVSMLDTIPVSPAVQDALTKTVEVVKKAGVAGLKAGIPGVSEIIDVFNKEFNLPVFGPTSLKEALMTGLTKGQDYTVEQAINDWYLSKTGEDNTDQGRTSLVGDAASIFGTSVMGLTGFPDWLDANEAAALSAYSVGVDTNGDGEVDLNGHQAVTWLYGESVNGFGRLWFEIVTDPLSWLPVLGGGGKLIRRGGQAVRMNPEAGAFRRVVGSAIEAGGTSIYRGSRVAEEAADLGAGVALEGIARGVRKLGATAPHATSRTQKEVFDVGSMQGNILARENRARGAKIIGPNGRALPNQPGSAVPPAGPATPPPSSATPSPAPPAGGTPNAPRSVTPLPRGAGARSVAPPAIAPPTTSTSGATAPPPSAPVDMEPGDAIEVGTPRTVIVKQPDGQTYRLVTREDDGTVVVGDPVSYEEVAQQAADHAESVVAVEDIARTQGQAPARWTPNPEYKKVKRASGGYRTIDVTAERVGYDAWNRVKTEMNDAWWAHETAMRNMGTGDVQWNMAINSSAIARDTIDAMRRQGIEPGPEWDFNADFYHENFTYQMIEEVIRLPWARTADQRKFLSTTDPVTVNGRLVQNTTPRLSNKNLPESPTPEEIELANTFVNVVEQHRLWLPEDMDNPDFAENWKQAGKVDQQLRELGEKEIVGNGIYQNAGRPLDGGGDIRPRGIATPRPDSSSGIPATEAPDSSQPARAVTEPDASGLPDTDAPLTPRQRIEQRRAEARTTGRQARREAVGGRQSTTLVDESFDPEGRAERTYEIGNGAVTIQANQVDGFNVALRFKRDYPDYRGNEWWRAHYEAVTPDGKSNGTEFYAPTADEAVGLANREAVTAGRVAGVPPTSAAEVPAMGQQVDDIVGVPDDLSPVANSVKRTDARGNVTVTWRLKKQLRLPAEVGDTTQWLDYRIEKVHPKGHIVTGPDGEFAFTVEMVKGKKFTNKRYRPVAADRLRLGEVEYLPMQFAGDAKGVSLAEIMGIAADRTRRVDTPVETINEPEPAAPRQSEPDPVAAEADRPAPETGSRAADVEEPAGEPVDAGTTAVSRLTPEQRRARQQRLAGRRTLEPVAQADLPEGLTRAEDMYWIDPDRIEFDEAQFQSREETNQQWVDTIAATWNDRRIQPINVVEIDGRYIAVSGHHRTLAAQQAKANGTVDRVRVKVIKADSIEQAIEEGVRDSIETNIAGSLKPSPLDDARSVQLLREKGATPGLGGKLGPFSGERVRRIDAVAKLPTSVKAAIRNNWQGIPHDLAENPIPTGVIDPMRMTERKGADLQRLVDEGMYDAAGLDNFYRNTLMLDEMRMSDADFESFIDLTLGNKEVVAQFRATQDSLFAIDGISREGFDPITRALREEASERTRLKRTQATLTTASNKTEQVKISRALKKETAELAKRETTLGDALRKLVADEQVALKRASRTTEGRLVVQTAAGKQYGMTFGGSAPIETPTTPIVGGTATSDDLLAPPERTPEQIRADELAAGQTDMFSARTETEQRVVEKDRTTGKAFNGEVVGIVPPGMTRIINLQRGPYYASRSGVVQIDADTGGAALFGRDLSKVEVDKLSQHPFTNGDNVMTRMGAHYDSIMIQSKGKMWPEEAELLAAKKTLEEYEAHLLANVFIPGVLPQRVTRGIAKLPAPVQKALKAVADVLRLFIKGLDATQQYYRERALFGHLKGPSYVLTQTLGNASMLAVGGQWGALGRYANMRDAWNAARKTQNESIAARGAAQGMSELDIARQMFQRDPGVSSYGKLQAQVGSRKGKAVMDTYQGMRGNVEDPLLLARALNKVSFGKAGVLAGSKAYAKQGALWDGAMRESVAHAHTIREYREVIPDYRNQTINRIVGWGNTKEVAISAWDDFMRTTGKDLWTMDQVIDHFTPILNNQGRATSLGRDWQKAVYDVEKRVDDKLRRLTFSGEETRFDLVAKRMFIFHHFVSRQSWFLASQAAHHPMLINLYFNAQEELERLAEGMPDYMQNWVKFLSVGGVGVFLNPTALAASFLTFTNYGNRFKAEGETVVGGFAQQVADVIGFNPLVMQGLNLSGALGDTLPADPFMLWREMRAATLAVNWARYWGFGDDVTPLPDLDDQAMNDLRELLSGLNPLLDDPVLARDAQADTDRDIQIIMADEAQRRGIDIESDAFLEASMDPESDLYQTALKRYRIGETVRVGTDTLLGPFRPRMLQVNKDNKPIYASLTREQKGIVNTIDPQAKLLKNQQAIYHEIGSEDAQVMNGAWSDIAYGHLFYDLEVDGVTYTPEQIHDMSEDERRLLADAFLVQYTKDGDTALEDVNAMRAARDIFLQDPANAEYARYDTWSGDVRDYEGGVMGYWAEITDPNSEQFNENAAIYYRTVIEDKPSWQQEKALTNIYAFMAIRGDSPDAFAPNPTVTGMYGISDPTGVANNPAKAQEPRPPSEFETEAVEGTPEYLAEMERYSEAVDRRQAEFGINPDIPFNELTSKTRVAIEDSLEEDGIYEPDAPYATTVYLEWAQKQPAGADTSIAAFLIANERDHQASSHDRLQESLNAPPLASVEDDDVWVKLDALLFEYDHTYNKKKSGGSSGSSTTTTNEDWVHPLFRP